MQSHRRHLPRAALGAVAIAALLGACSADGEAAPATPRSTPSLPERQGPLVEPTATAPALGAESEGAESEGADTRISASPGDEGQTDADDAPADGGDAASRSLAARAEEIARHLLTLANEARDDEGADRLAWADCAAEQAGHRAQAARALDELAHEPLSFDCEGELVGENLVRGDAPAANLHRLWMESEDHRENILSDDFTRAGIACVAHATGDRTEPAEAEDDIGGWVCSQMFYG
ncbi:CAP domain-containing protein [Demequina sp. NBRC 110053]|uniref:CAP domain-containing protein n=1 Tax=Demequina sp. NBRC 110053 TaxID=1570342 RepID=UPI001185FF14|nr:CAP domain-containing protein [Demequina sp. NBRC 110053]